MYLVLGGGGDSGDEDRNSHEFCETLDVTNNGIGGRHNFSDVDSDAEPS